MDIQFRILLLSFIVTTILAILLIPILKKLKVGQIERDDGPESHLKKQGTPTMGGIIIAIGITIISIFTCIYYTKIDAEVSKKILAFLFIGIGFGLVGFIDDFKKLILKNTKGLSPKLKMLGLLIISTCYVLYLIKYLNIGTQTYIPIIKVFLDMPMIIYIPFAIIVLLATTNAINLTDGVDGLATTITTIILTCLTVIGMIYGNNEVILFGSMIIGTCLAFLLFNLHPAKIMMGDTGSLMLGGIIAGLALYLKIPLLLIVIALVPVIETLSVMIQVVYFKKTGNRIFKMAPLHHHFELSGWKESKVVIIFSLTTLILCIIGLNII